MSSVVIWSEYQRFMTTTLDVSDQGYVYTVKPGSNLLTISQDIKEAGLASLPSYYLYIYGRLQNKARQVKAGEYLIKPNTTLPELLELLITNRVIQYPFTIIEGITTQQLITMVCNEPRFVKTLTTCDLREIRQQVLQNQRHGEGEFAPETYYYSAGTSDKQILIRAHQHMIDTLAQAWLDKSENLPYKSPYEALIMASIIEKETGIAEERTQIAGVFVRRLQKGMKLQTDPTVIYGMGEQFDGNLRRKDLKKDTPYNTYTRYGLPPTPIALPSKESIVAALHPAQGDSLFFVATGQDGRHVFSATLDAHNKAVRKYQLKR